MFVAYSVSVELVASLQPLLASLRIHDANLATQAQDAATSACLNLAEGSGRRGADRRRCYRIAYGSCREVRAALDVAVACGWVPPGSTAAALAARLGGLVWPLAK